MYGKGFGTSETPKSKDVSVDNSIDRSTIRATGNLPLQQFCPSLDTAFKGLKVLHSDPLIVEIDNFIEPHICDKFILLAQEKGKQIQSQTFSSLTSSKRTSTTWFISYKDIPEFLSAINKLTKFPLTQYEEPQIVQYLMGQQFSWHYDAIPKSMLDKSGQRVATILVYLNDVGQGGATCFKDLNIKVQPKKGKGLLFFPSKITGEPDDRTLHSGQIAFDTKWIAQLWVHQHDYEPSTFVGTHQEGIQAVEEYLTASRLSE